MNCPACGSAQTHITRGPEYPHLYQHGIAVEEKVFSTDNVVLRRRRCEAQACAAEFWTLEKIIQPGEKRMSRLMKAKSSS